MPDVPVDHAPVFWADRRIGIEVACLDPFFRNEVLADSDFWVDQLVLPQVVVDKPLDDCDFFVSRQLAVFVPKSAVLVERFECDLSCSADALVLEVSQQIRRQYLASVLQRQ